MKKLIFMLIAANGAISAIGQPIMNKYQDKDLSRWVLDLNFLGGGYFQQMKTANTAGDYLNGVNMNTGNLEFKNGTAFGGDAQIAYFLGKNRHWGIGTGVLYMRESGDVTLDAFHAEYQSVDNNGYTFRQVLSTNNVAEHVKIDNFNIPLLLKYKNRFSKHWGFTADAGVLLNLQMKNTYNTNAAFDYEAIYKFDNTDGKNTPVYDNAATPAANDFLITRAQYVKNNTDGNVQGYFDSKRAQGFNVGLGVNPTNKSGTVNYSMMSVGFLVQPSVNYFFSDHVALNLGVYYLYQPVDNNVRKDYMMTNKLGDYSSVLNTVSHTDNQSFGGNVGLRFFLGRGRQKMQITSIDQNNPSYCGSCDGSITLHGLEAGKHTLVNYTVDGATLPGSYETVAANDGSVKLPALCAGTYTGIKVKTGKKNATGANVTLVDPPLTITGHSSTAPTAKGVCDGTITFNGLPAGQHETVTYRLNSNQAKSVETIVSAENSITITGMCEGIYTEIVVHNKKCSTSITDLISVVLAAPVPVPVIETPAPAIATPEAEVPVLFDFDKSVIRKSAYPILNKTYEELKNDNSANLKVDGNTDAIGTKSYNQKLSARRAIAVKKYLHKKGISSSRIKTEGNGENDPVAPNKTATGRSKNRRADLQIIKK
jgi:outer membrane protein OmpA-like peptidoglycan-associated protein